MSSTLYSSTEQFAAQLQSLAPELFESTDRGHSGVAEGGHLQSVEQEEILKVLDRFGGNKTKAAEYLGISQTTLWRRLKHMSADHGAVGNNQSGE